MPVSTIEPHFEDGRKDVEVFETSQIKLSFAFCEHYEVCA